MQLGASPTVGLTPRDDQYTLTTSAGAVSNGHVVRGVGLAVRAV
jgi:hypothetical protein